MSQDDQRSGWFSGLFASKNHFRALPSFAKEPVASSSSLQPGELIGVGCNSAVWAAAVAADSDDDRTHQLAVKVLYNYYAATGADDVPAGDAPDDEPPGTTYRGGLVKGLMMQQQLERESSLRPVDPHPNIVPLISYFVDRAPGDEAVAETAPTAISDMRTEPATSDCGESAMEPSQQWQGADVFTEGFGGRPHTYFLLMPRFDATLGDLLSGKWQLSSTSPEFADCKQYEMAASLTDPAPPPPATVSSSSEHDSVSASISQEGTPSVGVSEPIGDVPSSNNPSCSTRVDGVLSSITAGVFDNVLSPEDVVAILAQVFDAVAELERIGVAHRDIKLNNILVRRCTLPTTKEEYSSGRSSPRQDDRPTRVDFWFNKSGGSVSCSPFHVALTDFGCAVRTSRKSPRNPLSYLLSGGSSMIRSLVDRFDNAFGGPSSAGATEQQSSTDQLLSHSGNTALLAPEVTTRLFLPRAGASIDDSCLTGADYLRSDIWAAATLAYPLTGVPNPFTNGTLDSVDYQEVDLPPLPDRMPGVLSWLVSECLKRDPAERPAADVVADVLHAWCLVRQLHQRHRQRRNSVDPTTAAAAGRDVSGGTAVQSDYWLSPSVSGKRNETSPHEMMHCSSPEGMEVIDGLLSSADLSESVRAHLDTVLNVSWASDWLSGPARIPDGLRVRFYRRITIDRFAFLLRIVYSSELDRSRRVTSKFQMHFN